LGSATLKYTFIILPVRGHGIEPLPSPETLCLLSYRRIILLKQKRRTFWIRLVFLLLDHHGDLTLVNDLGQGV